MDLAIIIQLKVGRAMLSARHGHDSKALVPPASFEATDEVEPGHQHMQRRQGQANLQLDRSPWHLGLPEMCPSTVFCHHQLLVTKLGIFQFFMVQKVVL